MFLKRNAACLCVLIACGFSLLTAVSTDGAVTAEQRRELADLRRDIGKVQALITRKDFDEAQKALDDAEQRLKKVMTDAEIKENDRLVSSIFKQLEQKRQLLDKRRGGPGAGDGISFVKEVAPILEKHCTKCHTDGNAKGGLRLDTFAGMEQGGGSGPLLVAGNDRGSLIMLRMLAPARQRMPKGGEALPKAELQKIATWIDQGAKFDGEDKSASIASADRPSPSSRKVTIAMATGDEKVSFKEDIAPFMSNLCVRCHSGAKPRDGFSLETFEKLMQGGKDGPVVVPGKLADSRIWHLVGEQDPVKMPPGQALITRKNWSDLKTWIEEGAHFDGKDAKAPIRSLVPTEEQQQAMKLAELTPAELSKRRLQRTEALWHAAFPTRTATRIETSELLLVGSVSEERLKQVQTWAEADLKMLRKAFQTKESPLWRGRLAVFVFQERFDYEEFSRTNEEVQIPADAHGHVRVTAGQADAYVSIQNIADEVSEDSPGFRVLLSSLLTEALLQRSKNKVPDWVARGTGLALAARENPKNDYFDGLAFAARKSVLSLSKPQEVFADGTFSPADLGPVGYTLVTHMLNAGGDARFVQFLNRLEEGTELSAALKGVYGADTLQLAVSYVKSLSNSKGSRKRGK